MLLLESAGATVSNWVPFKNPTSNHHHLFKRNKRVVNISKHIFWGGNNASKSCAKISHWLVLEKMERKCIKSKATTERNDWYLWPHKESIVIHFSKVLLFCCGLLDEWWIQDGMKEWGLWVCVCVCVTIFWWCDRRIDKRWQNLVSFVISFLPLLLHAHSNHRTGKAQKEAVAIIWETRELPGDALVLLGHKIGKN